MKKNEQIEVEIVENMKQMEVAEDWGNRKRKQEIEREKEEEAKQKKTESENANVRIVGTWEKDQQSKRIAKNKARSKFFQEMEEKLAETRKKVRKEFIRDKERQKTISEKTQLRTRKRN